MKRELVGLAVLVLVLELELQLFSSQLLFHGFSLEY
jgi:hypothetical protein